MSIQRHPGRKLARSQPKLSQRSDVAWANRLNCHLKKAVDAHNARHIRE